MKALNGIVEDPMDGEERIRTKELEAQKARIVAQMAPVQEEDEEYPEKELEQEKARVRPKVVDRENVPPPAPTTYAIRAREREREREKERETRIVGKAREYAVAPGRWLFIVLVRPILIRSYSLRSSIDVSRATATAAISGADEAWWI